MADRDREIDDEIRFHLEEEERLLAGRGALPAEARRQARRRFGGVALAREDTRAVWAWTALEQAWQDVRIGARLLRKSPGFTAAAVLTLALGIGANTAVFSLFKAVVLAQLPVRDADRLVLFNGDTSEGTRTTSEPISGAWDLFSSEAYTYFTAQPLPFESLAAIRSGRTEVLFRNGARGGDAGPARIYAQLVSGNYFETMGAGIAAGRALQPADDRPAAPPAAVVSYAFWQQAWAGDPAAVGTVAMLNDTAFTIVGVASPEFFGERVRSAPAFWVPLAFQPAIELLPAKAPDPESYWLTPIGRLAPGATREGAQAAATAALRRFLTDRAGQPISAERARRIENTRVELAAGARGVSSYRKRLAEPLGILIGVVALVLLIACANVGSLVLARAANRRTEFSMRAALGATRRRLARQLLVESLLLASVGAAAGVALAAWSLDGLTAMIGASGQPVHPGIDAQALVYTSVAAITAALVFGFAPMVSAGSTTLMDALKAHGRASKAGMRRRSVDPLIVLELAACLVLLVGTGLLGRTLLNLEHDQIGLDPDHVLVSRIYPRMAGYTPQTINALYSQLRDRLSALPGVEAVSFTRYTPFSGNGSHSGPNVEGYTSTGDESVEMAMVGPQYAETLRIPVRLGRTLDAADISSGNRVGMVNEAFVRRFLPGRNPIGAHFAIDNGVTPDTEIVGVLADAQFHNAREPIEPVEFITTRADYGQFSMSGELMIRVAAEAGANASAIRDAVRGADPNLPMESPHWLRDQVSDTFQTERLSMQLVSGFSALALVLACVGLYGTLAQRLARRTGEIGIRLALGASRPQVLGLMMRDALRPLAIGLGLGIPAALAASRLLSTLLFGVNPADPWSLAGAVAALAAVATAAGFIPARRAARVDPMTTLRAE